MSGEIYPLPETLPVAFGEASKEWISNWIANESIPGTAAEKQAPDNIPAPGHPEPQPEYVPSARRAQE